MAEGSDENGCGGPRTLFSDPTSFDEWAAVWRQRVAQEGWKDEDRCAAMLSMNPLFIPRNHLVEEAIAAALAGDFGPFEILLEVLSEPFHHQPGRERYAEGPEPNEIVRQTFCGT